MRKIGACVCSAVITVIALGSAGRVQAGPIESLALVAQVGGAFDYGIKVALDHGLVIAPGSSITLSGLAGVTGASVGATLTACFTAELVDSAEVRFTSLPTCPVFDPVAATLLIGDLQVFSTAASIGLASYSIQAGSAGIVSGTVIGPVDVSEPYSLPLLAIGLIGCILFVRGANRDYRAKADRYNDGSLRVSAHTRVAIHSGRREMVPLVPRLWARKANHGHELELPNIETVS